MEPPEVADHELFEFQLPVAARYLVAAFDSLFPARKISINEAMNIKAGMHLLKAGASFMRSVEKWYE